MNMFSKTLTIAGFIFAVGAFAPVQASTNDHSGFGQNLFAMQAPAGLQDPAHMPVLDAANMDKAALEAAQIDPAAGNPDQHARPATNR
jgi:hypothetical protein